jgi:hypothetical protein
MPREPAAPVSMANDSSGYEEVPQLWRTFAMFKTVRDDAQRQRLCSRECFLARGAVRQDARKLDYIG